MKFVNTSFAWFSLMVLLWPFAAMAQIDTGPDGLGIYFDTDATVVSTTAAAGDFVEAYLIATNLTQSGEIGLWAAGMCPDGWSADIDGTPTHGGFNYSMNMPGDPCWSCLTFGFDPPLPVGNIVILATLNIQVYEDLEPIYLNLRSEGCYYQTFDGGDEEFPFYPSSGSSDLPVATINGVAPVAVENLELDSIKAMYR